MVYCFLRRVYIILFVICLLISLIKSITNGDCPVEEFITSPDVNMRAKMVGLLELSEEKGNQQLNILWNLGFPVSPVVFI